MSQRIFEAWLGTAILLAASAVLIWGIPVWVEPSDFAEIPPDLFPRVAVGAVMVFSTLMVASRLLSRDNKPAQISKQTLVLGAGLLAMFALAVALILSMGYVAGGAVLVAALMAFMGVRRIGLLVTVALAAPLALFAFFDLLLGIPMP